MTDTRRTLAAACRSHLPQLADTWNGEFGGICECGDPRCDQSTAPTSARHLDISTENFGQVAYSPDGIAADDHKRRRKLTLGRYLSRQCGIEITADIERGINNIVAELMAALGPATGDEFTTLRGRDIVSAYRKAVGLHSCMTGEENEEIADWFSHFPDKIGLVVWRETDGRALLWTTDDGRQLLDRVYAGNAQLARNRYAEWCKTNGVRNCYRGQTLGDMLHDFDGCVTLGHKAVDGRLVPYLDTFKYASDAGKFYSSKQTDTQYCCDATDGLTVCGGAICECCENHVDQDDAYAIEDGYVCNDCYCETYFTCEWCNEVTHNDYYREVDENAWCESCCNRHATECARCNVATAHDTIEVGGAIWCNSCTENHAAICERCNTNIPSDDTANVDDCTWCGSCAADHAQTCNGCRTYYPLDDLAVVDGESYCEDCCPEPVLATTEG